MNAPEPPHLGYPAAPPPARAGSWADVVVRSLAGVIGVLATGFWLLCAYMILSSVFSTSPASDPHGYSLIFGTVLGVPAGLVGALLVPLIFPRRSRRRAYLVVGPTFVTVQALIFLAMYLS